MPSTRQRYNVQLNTNYPDGTDVYTSMMAMEAAQVIRMVEHKLKTIDASSWIMTVVPSPGPDIADRSIRTTA